MSQEHAANVQSLSSHVTTLYFKTWEFPSSRKSVHVMFACTDSPDHPHILYHILSTHMLHYSGRSTLRKPYRLPWLNLYTGWHAWTHTIHTNTHRNVHRHVHKDTHTHTHTCTHAHMYVVFCMFASPVTRTPRQAELTAITRGRQTLQTQPAHLHIELQWLTQHRSTCMDTHTTHAEMYTHTHTRTHAQSPRNLEQVLW